VLFLRGSTWVDGSRELGGEDCGGGIRRRWRQEPAVRAHEIKHSAMVDHVRPAARLDHHMVGSFDMLELLGTAREAD
jgi:hypothetical protein